MDEPSAALTTQEIEGSVCLYPRYEVAGRRRNLYFAQAG